MKRVSLWLLGGLLGVSVAQGASQAISFAGRNDHALPSGGRSTVAPEMVTAQEKNVQMCREQWKELCQQAYSRDRVVLKVKDESLIKGVAKVFRVLKLRENASVRLGFEFPQCASDEQFEEYMAKLVLDALANTIESYGIGSPKVLNMIEGRDPLSRVCAFPVLIEKLEEVSACTSGNADVVKQFLVLTRSLQRLTRGASSSTSSVPGQRSSGGFYAAFGKAMAKRESKEKDKPSAKNTSSAVEQKESSAQASSVNSSSSTTPVPVQVLPTRSKKLETLQWSDGDAYTALQIVGEFIVIQSKERQDRSGSHILEGYDHIMRTYNECVERSKFDNEALKKWKSYFFGNNRAQYGLSASCQLCDDLLTGKNNLFVSSLVLTDEKQRQILERFVKNCKACATKYFEVFQEALPCLVGETRIVDSVNNSASGVVEQKESLAQTENVNSSSSNTTTSLPAETRAVGSKKLEKLVWSRDDVTKACRVLFTGEADPRASSHIEENYCKLMSAYHECVENGDVVIANEKLAPWAFWLSDKQGTRYSLQECVVVCDSLLGSKTFLKVGNQDRIPMECFVKNCRFLISMFPVLSKAVDSNSSTISTSSTSSSSTSIPHSSGVKQKYSRGSSVSRLDMGQMFNTGNAISSDSCIKYSKNKLWQSAFAKLEAKFALLPGFGHRILGAYDVFLTTIENFPNEDADGRGAWIGLHFTSQIETGITLGNLEAKAKSVYAFINLTPEQVKVLDEFWSELREWKAYTPVEPSSSSIPNTPAPVSRTVGVDSQRKNDTLKNKLRAKLEQKRAIVNSPSQNIQKNPAKQGANNEPVKNDDIDVVTAFINAPSNKLPKKGPVSSAKKAKKKTNNQQVVSSNSSSSATIAPEELSAPQAALVTPIPVAQVSPVMSTAKKSKSNSPVARPKQQAQPKAADKRSTAKKAKDKAKSLDDSNSSSTTTTQPQSEIKLVAAATAVLQAKAEPVPKVTAMPVVRAPFDDNEQRTWSRFVGKIGGFTDLVRQKKAASLILDTLGKLRARINEFGIDRGERISPVQEKVIKDLLNAEIFGNNACSLGRTFEEVMQAIGQEVMEPRSDQARKALLGSLLNSYHEICDQLRPLGLISKRVTPPGGLQV